MLLQRTVVEFCVFFAGVFVLLVQLQPTDAAQGNWSNAIRHGKHSQHNWNGSSSINYIRSRQPRQQHHRYQNHNQQSQKQLQVMPQDVRQVYHSYQRGSARIPYGGSARIGNSYGPKKMYRGTLSTTILDGGNHVPRWDSSRSQLHHRVNKHRNRDVSNWEPSRDEPVRGGGLQQKQLPDACAKCPPDRAVIAKRGSITTIMEKLPIIPCFPWSNVANIRHEMVMGPEPGQRVGEGSHSLVTRLSHHDRPVATCHARYNVIVRKCEPLNIEGSVKVNCPLGEAWGATCTFSCPDGYQLVGANSTECNSHLEWSNELPQCAVTTSCTVPITPENGHITCRTPQHKPVRSQSTLPDGTTCHYWCNPGYRIPPAQNQLATVNCIAGEWNSTQDPTCVETNTLHDAIREPPRGGRHRLSSPRLGRKHCPKAKCQNGGKCYVILGEQLCLCRHGFTGPSCSETIIDNSIK